MDALELSLRRSSGLITTAYSNALRLKAAGFLDVSSSSGLSQINSFRDDAANRERYGAFRGWLYSAINALATEGAGQPMQIGRMKGVSKNGKRREPTKPGRSKAYDLCKMTMWAAEKAARTELEIITDDPLLETMDAPNPMQGRWQFVYSFFANLLLTGWSYVIGGETDDGKLEFYSLPTTWVKPDHTKGPFSQFRIVNPRNPQAAADQKPIGRKNVAFAHLPNPADPLGALSPAQAVIQAIRIDDHIQACQEQFFNNGIFPSVIVTIGKDPHPEVAAGIRPRLSGVQRRQVQGAIKKVMGGIANYGNPAIVDGLIESIERLSASQNEIGWEKSEGAIRTRILSAYGVHPYILGEPVSVGGYAQAAKIEERFCKRVNTVLDMLGTVMTNFAGPMSSIDDKTLIWWEPAVPHDPSLRWQNLREGRKNGDVSRNEFRAELNLPPDETGGDRKKMFAAADLTAIAGIQKMVASGEMKPEQAQAIYEMAYDLDPKDAELIAGDEPPPPPEPVPGAIPGQPPNPALPAPKPKKPPKPEQALANATDELKRALAVIRSPGAIAGDILELLDGKGQPRVPAGSAHGGEFASNQSGGSASGKESYADRIEGTQEEADREVKRYDKKAQQAKEALAAAVARQTVAKDKVAGLEKALAGIAQQKSVLEEKLAASKARLAALRAQLKKSLESDIDDEITTLRVIVAGFKALSSRCDAIIEEALEIAGEKFNPAQPRVPAGSQHGGRFASSSGGAAGGTEFGGFSTEKEVVEALSNNPERQALHQKIIDSHFAGKTPVENPTAYIMGGGPASGKSSILGAGHVDIDKNTVEINADDIKGMLPEYNAKIKAGDPGAASFSHEESSYLAKKIQEKAVAEKYNSLLDGTGDNSLENLKGKVDKMRAGGHKVIAHYVSVPVEEAVRRNVIRAYGGEKAKDMGYDVSPDELKKKGNGRLPPETMLRAVHANVSKILPEAVKTGLFDEITLWDTHNSTGKVQKVLSSSGGKTTTHSQALWDDFVAKGA